MRPCETSTRSREAMPFARQPGLSPGWSAGDRAQGQDAVQDCASSAGNTPLSAAMALPLWRRWKNPANAAVPSACSLQQGTGRSQRQVGQACPDRGLGNTLAISSCPCCCLEEGWGRALSLATEHLLRHGDNGSSGWTRQRCR